MHCMFDCCFSDMVGPASFGGVEGLQQEVSLIVKLRNLSVVRIAPSDSPSSEGMY